MREWRIVQSNSRPQIIQAMTVYLLGLGIPANNSEHWTKLEAFCTVEEQTQLIMALTELSVALEKTNMALYTVAMKFTG